MIVNLENRYTKTLQFVIYFIIFLVFKTLFLTFQSSQKKKLSRLLYLRKCFICHRYSSSL